ncbi:MAG TPA: hypothetical protein VF593_01030 [Chthoniobacteraceae bacterium]
MSFPHSVEAGQPVPLQLPPQRAGQLIDFASCSKLRRGLKSAAAGFDLPTVFFATNWGLFLAMCGLVYQERWVRYLGPSPAALAAYYGVLAIAFVSTAVASRVLLRHFQPPAWLLGLVQAGLLIYFAGGLLSVGGERLQWSVFLGIRFDKYLHFASAFIAAAVIQEVCRQQRISTQGLLRWLICLAVLGLGSLVEVAQLAEKLLSPVAMSYDDPLGDMLANAGGALLFTLWGASFLQTKPGREPNPAS